MSGIAGPIDRHDDNVTSITNAGNYVQRRIDLIIEIGQGQNGAEGSKKYTVRGLRVAAQIEKLSAQVGGSGACQVTVWGLPFPLMQDLSSMARPIPIVRRNKLTVMAGDQWHMAEVFSGDVWEAWADYNAMPEVGMTISCTPGAAAQMKPVDPISVDGQMDAVILLQQLAAAMGKDFENSGVPQTMLDHPYFPGTAWDQMTAISTAAHINATIDGNTLAIWPVNGARQQDQIPLISATTGMVGYPSYAGYGIRVRTIFNNQIRFGSKFRIDSEIKAANGEWIITMLSHDLAAEMPDGPWFTDLEGFRLGQSAGLPSQ